MNPHHLLFRTSRLVLAGAVAAVLATSCSSDGSSGSEGSKAVTTTAATTTAATAEDLCADRDALKASIDDLKQVDVRAEGTNGVDAAVAAVQEDLKAVGESADAALEPEVKALQDAVDELGAAVENIDTGGVEAAATAIADVATSAGTLISSLQDATCE